MTTIQQWEPCSWLDCNNPRHKEGYFCLQHIIAIANDPDKPQPYRMCRTRGCESRAAGGNFCEECIDRMADEVEEAQVARFRPRYGLPIGRDDTKPAPRFSRPVLCLLYAILGAFMLYGAILAAPSVLAWWRGVK